MTLTLAATGFAVFILSASVIQGQNDWKVTYTSTEICALKGSTVEIRCTYTHPSTGNDHDTAVKGTLWFIHVQGKEPEDLRADSQYSGRVEHSCKNNICTLRIRDVRESDSAEYKFMLITNQPGGRFTGSPGVTLSVTEFKVQKTKQSQCKVNTCTWSELKCESSCRLPGRTSYIWYKNGETIWEETSFSYKDYFYPGDSYSCAVKGHEDFAAPSVCGHGDSCNMVICSNRNICAFKGSSVNISCVYISKEDITSAFWFNSERSDQWHYRSQPEDFYEDYQYEGRVHVETKRRRTTLTITDLRKSDSAQYHFKFKTRSFEWRSSLPGTTLTVTDSDLQVQVIWSSSGPKLICHSSCLTDYSFFVWYKNGTEIQEETSLVYRGNIDPADTYSCAYKSYRSPTVYAPKLPSVSVSPSGDIMKNSSVTLTCSSDANPTAKYTWYKMSQKVLSEEQQLVFKSVQPSDSGGYYCTAENDLGKKTSESVYVNVKYGPETSTLSVSPSGEIVEDSSVTLTCSSDANPAATYTWYKEYQILIQGPEDVYHFTPISSEDRGIYYCKTENQYGQIKSSSMFIDVQYAPKLPSVSVSPSGEIVEGSSVTLTCSSDANPAANYTWYKESEDSPKASGQIFTITDFTTEDHFNYYCTAENKWGSQSSTLHLTISTGAKISAAIGITTAFLLVIILLIVILWIRRNKSKQSRDEERPNNNGAQSNMNPMAAAAQRQPAEQQDDLHYASIRFCGNQQGALLSSIRPPQPHEEAVEYSTVTTGNTRGASGTRRRDKDKDFFALYSQVNKNSSEQEKLAKNKKNKKSNMNPVSATTAAAAQRQTAEQQDDLHYASVRFCGNQQGALLSSIRPPQPHEEAVEYGTVKTGKSRDTSGTRRRDKDKDFFALYSPVIKKKQPGKIQKV